MISTAPNVIPAALLKTLAVKGNTDFETPAYVGAIGAVLAVHPSVPANNLQQFIGLLKANPCKYMFGSAGPGTPHHMGLELFNVQAGTRSVHVPYKSIMTIVTEVAAGNVHYSFLPFSAVQFANSGRLKILGSNGLHRDPAYPDIPTLDDQGRKGFEVPAKYFLLAPKNTPQAVVNKLNAATNAVIASEAYAAKFKALGGFEVPRPSTPAQTLQVLAHEDDRYTRLVRDHRVQFD